jgi:hypothetical protein
MKLVLASGVEFDEEKHEYYYKGRQLSGVTGLISKKLGLKMPQEFVEEHQIEGVHVHKAVQKWIETGDAGSVHPGVRWITETFFRRYEARPAAVYSETLVSDFNRFASAVDIIVEETPGGKLDIYDVKKGVFKRDYVTWQLSIYRWFIERFGGREVGKCVCVAVRDREYYDIFPKPYDRVEKLLYG